MGGFFSGLAGSIGDHLHEQHLLNLQQQVESKRSLLDNYNMLLKDPHMEDVHDQISQTLLKAAATDPTKLHKQIGKPGGEFDPTQWQVLAQQRHAGAVPSPVNRGQNPTPIPAPGNGQQAGQAQMAPAWNDATGVGIPPPPGAAGGMGVAAQQQSAPQGMPGMPGAMDPANPSSAPAGSNNGSGNGAGAGQQASQLQQLSQSIAPPPGIAQSNNALPGTGPAPSGADLATPMQAAAVAPPIPPTPLMSIPPPAPVADDWNATHGSFGGLTKEALAAWEAKHQSILTAGVNQSAIEYSKKKLEMLEPYLKSMNPQIANMIRMEVMQGGTGSAGNSALINTMFAAPTKLQLDVTSMDPVQKMQLGIPADSSGKWTVEQDRFHNTTGAYQGWAGTVATINAQGEQGQQSKNTALGPGGVQAKGGGSSYAPSQVTPRKIINKDGSVGYQSMAGSSIGAPPVEGFGVAPQMMPTLRDSSTTIDSAGNMHTSSRTQKGTTVGGTAAAAGKGTGTAATSAAAGSSSGVSSSSAPATPARIAPFNPTGRIDNIVRLMGQDQASGEKLIASRQDKIAVGKRMAELGIDPNNVTGSMRDRAAQARTVIPHIDDIMKIIDEADKAGEIGLVASRWNDFLTNKLGKDPTKDQIFSKLSSHLSFLTTAVGMAHGGTRAGSSEPIIEHWEQTLQAKDAATLRQKLNTAKAWMKNYADMVPKGNDRVPPPPPPPPGGTLDDLINKYK